MVLQRWRDGKALDNEEEVTRALLYLGFLPNALQRKSTRGGSAGRAQVAFRYNCVTSGDWGGLVEQFERDLAARQERRGARSRKEQEDITRVCRAAMGDISTGKLGQGIKKVISPGLADIKDPRVWEELQRKFLTNRQPLLASVSKVSPIDSFYNLKESLLSLEQGKSPGSGGCRPEYLLALGERL